MIACLQAMEMGRAGVKVIFDMKIKTKTKIILDSRSFNLPAVVGINLIDGLGDKI